MHADAIAPLFAQCRAGRRSRAVAALSTSMTQPWMRSRKRSAQGEGDLLGLWGDAGGGAHGAAVAALPSPSWFRSP